MKVEGRPGLRVKNQSREDILEPDKMLCSEPPLLPLPALCVQALQAPGHCEHCKCGFRLPSCGDSCMSLLMIATSPRVGNGGQIQAPVTEQALPALGEPGHPAPILAKRIPLGKPLPLFVL